MAREIPLAGGRMTVGVVRVGETVRRPLKPRAGFVHELFRHLEAKGFAGAPRFLGIDASGREILSFLPGYVPPELGGIADEQLDAAARLLRRLHDATADFAPKGSCEIVCHGDASPGNCVFVDGMPSAFIDFDDAHPGSRLEDLGYAAWLWIDIGNDELDRELQGRRVAQFFRNYGVAADVAIAEILAAQSALIARTGKPGVRGWALMVRKWALHCRRWVEKNRGALESAVRTAQR